MPIHVAITRKVLPGKEDEFKAALHKFLGESFAHGGVHGASMISGLPGTDSRDIGILRTFKDEAEKDAFYNSKLFKDWELYASSITEKPVYRQLTGLEAWFRSAAPPPRWKMAMVTLLGVFPTSLFLSVTIVPLMHTWPTWLRLLITATCMVSLLTWIVMPFLISILKGFIAPVKK